MDWNRSCSYDAEQKARFHREARKALKKVADTLGLDPSTYDLRSNKAGIAVSGEVTLHHERVYVQVQQSCMGPQSSILIRTCKGRKDYTGGPNNFAHIDTLDRPEELARLVNRIGRIDEWKEMLRDHAEDLVG